MSSVSLFLKGIGLGGRGTPEKFPMVTPSRAVAVPVANIIILPITHSSPSRYPHLPMEISALLTMGAGQGGGTPIFFSDIPPLRFYLTLVPTSLETSTYQVLEVSSASAPWKTALVYRFTPAWWVPSARIFSVVPPMVT